MKMRQQKIETSDGSAIRALECIFGAVCFTLSPDILIKPVCRKQRRPNDDAVERDASAVNIEINNRIM